PRPAEGCAPGGAPNPRPEPLYRDLGIRLAGPPPLRERRLAGGSLARSRGGLHVGFPGRRLPIPVDLAGRAAQLERRSSVFALRSVTSPRRGAIGLVLHVTHIH